MREVAVVSYAQAPMLRDAGACNEVELLMPPITEARERVGLDMSEIDFTCSGSCDYLQGASFAFVEGVDAVGAVPPICESHVEMDAAWALYEAWLEIQSGEADTALIYGFSKSSPGDLPLILALQMDPYYLAPLWPDSVSLAALQARVALESRVLSERAMAEVVAQSRRAAMDNPCALLSGEHSVEELLAEPLSASPLRRHDCPPITDGASALVLAAGERARQLCDRPVYLRGIEHRIESSHLGLRDLARSVSTAQAAEAAGVAGDKVEVAELHAQFSHQQLLLSQALGLSERTVVNPSGGPLAGNVMMAAGLDRIGAVMQHIAAGRADRGVAHATSGPCMQQNMVLVMEGA